MFQGSIVALVTPMHPDDRIDWDAWQSLIRWHLTAGTEGLVILGTTGESPTITSVERVRLIEEALKVVDGAIPVIVGTGSNSTADTVSMTEQACELGASAALVVTPYYNKPTQEGLVAHFSAAADVGLPIILYNVPSRTACDLLPETVLRLSEHPQIVSIKEATGDLDRLASILALNCGLSILTGDDATDCAFMLAGGHGVISVTANVAPTQMRALCDLALAGDVVAAKACDERLVSLHRDLFAESNPIPVKWALSKMGRIKSGIRLPLLPLSLQHQQTVLRALEGSGVIEGLSHTLEAAS